MLLPNLYKYDTTDCEIESAFNSLAPGGCGCYLKLVIFKLFSSINILSISYEIVFRWMPQGLTDKSTLVQIMAWCRQATSHYLNQYWPRSMSSYGVTRPQNVNHTFASMGPTQVHSFFYDAAIWEIKSGFNDTSASMVYTEVLLSFNTYYTVQFLPLGLMLSVGIENRGHWLWPSRSFWPFWLRIIGNSACPRDNST